MGYVTAWIVVSIITLGIYKLFELFVGKKERLAMIEKWGDRRDVSASDPAFPAGTSFMSSFSALRLGCLLLGMGVGFLTGYLICATTVPGYFTDHTRGMNELTSLIYGGSVLIFGGLGLVAAFMVELRITRKNKH